MSNTPIIQARHIINFLISLGFNEILQKGSHRFFKHPDGRTATVPDHKGEDLGKGIMLKILKDTESTLDEFMDWYLN
jgi:predicted RNA binding protein YcfA (HicA-like mRNA interferase family)